MTETNASKLSTLCTTLALVGVLLGLAFNSGGTPDAGPSAVAVAPAAAQLAD